MRTLALLFVLLLALWTVVPAPAAELPTTSQCAAVCPTEIDAPAVVRQVTSNGAELTAIVVLARTAFDAGQASDMLLFLHYRVPFKGELQVAASAVPLRGIKQLPPNPKQDGPNRVRVAVATTLPNPADAGAEVFVVARLVDLLPTSGDEVVGFSLDIVVPCGLELRHPPGPEITARLFGEATGRDEPLRFASPETNGIGVEGTQRFHYREGTELTLPHGEYLAMNATMADARHFHYRPNEAAKCRTRDRRGIPFIDTQVFLHLMPYRLRIFQGLERQLLVGEFSEGLNDLELPVPPVCTTPQTCL
ncbi:MAG: hypothetical protein ABI609_17305 [Acidobacteriota bacterium]